MLYNVSTSEHCQSKSYFKVFEMWKQINISKGSYLVWRTRIGHKTSGKNKKSGKYAGNSLDPHRHVPSWGFKRPIRDYRSGNTCPIPNLNPKKMHSRKEREMWESERKREGREKRKQAWWMLFANTTTETIYMNTYILASLWLF